jgi:hypothetical protein
MVQQPPEEGRITAERIRAKNKVVARLLAEEINLLEAAAWFRFLNDNPPEYPCRFRQTMPGGSDGEKACRQVISWVEVKVREQMPQSQADLVLWGLQGELDGLLAYSESIELPW